MTDLRRWCRLAIGTVVLVGLACVSLLGAVLFADGVRDAVVLRLRGAPATVEVVSLDRRTGSGPRDLVARYPGPDPAGEVVLRDWWLEVPEDRTIAIRYDPQDPSRAERAGTFWPWWTTAYPLFGALVLGSAPATACRTVLIRRRRRRAAGA